MHKVFLSFYNKDIYYKNHLVRLNDINSIFIDKSVGYYDIMDSDNLNDEQIRTKIRDEYLQKSSVTIVLVGKNTKHRKHVDWEIGSSVIDGTINKKSGIIVIYLPEVNNLQHSQIVPSNKAKNEIQKSFPYTNWTSWERGKVFNEHPYLPERILKNLKNNKVDICILEWNAIITNPDILKEAIEWTISTKDNQNWDTSIPFRRHNGN